jgi:serine O-acetyltransferase
MGHYLFLRPIAMHEISATEPDWSREKVSPCQWNSGLQLLRCIRGYQAARNHKGPLARIHSYCWVLRYRFWSIVAGAEIPIQMSIGGGLMMPHPNGIVIHQDAKIGPNCLIFQQVTLGGTTLGAPALEGHVDVGAGAKILGKVVIGAHAKIGANSVVLEDVPAGATAVGIPARILPARNNKAI